MFGPATITVSFKKYFFISILVAIVSIFSSLCLFAKINENNMLERKLKEATTEKEVGICGLSRSPSGKIGGFVLNPIPGLNNSYILGSDQASLWIIRPCPLSTKDAVEFMGPSSLFFIQGNKEKEID